MTHDILIAIVAAPQGLDGSVRLKSFAGDPENLKQYKLFQTARGALTLKSLRVQPNAVVAKFHEIADRTAAEGWRNVELFISRSQMPAPADDEYYQADLVGMTVTAGCNTAVGIVVAMPNYGAGDLLDIRQADGTAFLLPFNDTAVLDVDMDARVVTIDAAFLPE